MNEEKIFSVTQVNRYINHILNEDIVLQYIKIEGEVSNYKQSGAHAYFSIKDDEAQLDCVQFSASGYKPMLGDKVIITGKANFYAKTGKFSFLIIEIRPYGVGEIHRQFLLLKEKLEKLGLFSAHHKKAIPKYPTRIGVISSPMGAVIQDIINVAKRRNPYVDIVLFPAKVQGIGAEIEISKGIDYFNFSNVDTVILARGGGSMEDLAAFYTEELTLKVFDSIKPIITAIGHETDFSLVDYVSDMRAPTPSAAAELAVSLLSDIVGDFSYYLEKIYDFSKHKFTEDSNRIKFANLSLFSVVERKTTESDHKLQVLASQISTLNPMNVLLRGYAKVKHDDNEIFAAKQVQLGEEIDVIFFDGIVNCTANSIKRNCPKGEGK